MIMVIQTTDTTRLILIFHLFKPWNVEYADLAARSFNQALLPEIAQRATDGFRSHTGHGRQFITGYFEFFGPGELLAQPEQHLRHPFAHRMISELE